LLSANIHSNCEIKDYRVLAGFGACKSGIPSCSTLDRQNITLSYGQNMKLDSSWTPEESGEYLIGTVAAACFPCSSDYGVVQTLNFTIIDRESGKNDNVE